MIWKRIQSSHSVHVEIWIQNLQNFREEANPITSSQEVPQASRLWELLILSTTFCHYKPTEDKLAKCYENIQYSCYSRVSLPPFPNTVTVFKHISTKKRSQPWYTETRGMGGRVCAGEQMCLWSGTHREECSVCGGNEKKVEGELEEVECYNNKTQQQRVGKDLNNW